MNDDQRYYTPPDGVVAEKPLKVKKLKHPTIPKAQKYMNPTYYNEFTPQQWEELKHMETLSGLIHLPGIVPGEVSLDAAQPIARVAPTRVLLQGSGRPFAGPLGKQAGHGDE